MMKAALLAGLLLVSTSASPGLPQFRSIDGEGNNRQNPDWGRADTPLVRLTTVEYGGDGTGSELAPRVDSRGETINPRTVSNLLFDQSFDVPNDRGLSSFVFQWGQFLDHDMDLTEDEPPVGEANAPEDDISFPVPDDGTEQELPPGTIIPMLRSRFELDADGIRQQINQITSFIDASNVYGSDDERAEGLRARYGGFLLTGDGIDNVSDGSGDLLPINTLGLENAAPPTTGTGEPLDPESLFAAGDVRSNEQPGLTALHTLFVSEHNFQARRIAARLGLEPAKLHDPEIDETIYQLARRIVGAEAQAITYNEFLPALLGPDQLASYTRYDAGVDPGIANVFAHAMYRVGHTMLPDTLLLLESDGSPVADADVSGASVRDGHLPLGDAFFNPQLIVRFGIEPYLKGLAVQQIQEVDNLIVDGVRNLLFDPPAAFDLGATNLQRGRDHGLPDYNQCRVDFGLEPVVDFSEVTSDSVVAAALEAAYDGDIDDVDAWAAAISEDPIPGGSVGELIHEVLVDQFTRLRDGDRFFYERTFAGRRLDEIRNTLLSDIIRRNTHLWSIQDEVFRSESVLTYRAVEGPRGKDITLRVRGDRLQVVEGRGRRVVSDRSVADTDIVVLFGTSKHDRIRIDASVHRSFAGSIEAHGGAGRDSLIVRGAGGALVEPTRISVGELEVFYGNFERVRTTRPRPTRDGDDDSEGDDSDEG